jgi:hypothetical protein
MDKTVMRAAVLMTMVAIAVALGCNRRVIATAGEKSDTGSDMDEPDTFDGPVTFSGSVIVRGPVEIDGPAWVYGTIGARSMSIDGPLSFPPRLSQDPTSPAHKVIFDRGLTFHGPLTIHGALIVDGELTANGPLWYAALKKTAEPLKLLQPAQ